MAVNHKTDMRKDSKMALDINNVNVNIDVNFGQVSALKTVEKINLSGPIFAQKGS